VADDGGRGFGGVCLQGPGARVVGEGDLPGAQVADHFLVADLPAYVGAAAPSPRGDRSGAREECLRSGQVRQDKVLADVQVLRPGGICALALECPWRHR
jgi:hypothetical protein